MLELIIVIAILALVAGITVPRLVGQGRREIHHAADAVGDLLMMYAQRASWAQRPSGIVYDEGRHQIVLMLLDIDPARPNDPAEWRIDPFVRPVDLPRSIPPDGVIALAAGSRVDITQWPISSFPGQEREMIEIRLTGDDGHTRSVVLPGHALVPYQAEVVEDVLSLRQPIDLDQAGRHREDW